MQRVALDDHGGGDACGGGDLLVALLVVKDGAPEAVFRLQQLERCKLLGQRARNLQIFGVEIALRQCAANLAHGVGSPRVGAAPVEAGEMRLAHMAVAVVPQAGGFVLKVLDVPVVLVQRVVDERLVPQHHAGAQHEVRGHEQRIRPALLREVILVGYGVLEHAVAEAQRAVAQIVQLAQGDIQVFLLACRLVEREHGVAHRAGVHRPVGKPQLDVFVYAGAQQIEVFLILRHAVRLADAQIRHAAGPVPHHIHVHGSADDGIDCGKHAFPVKMDVCHIGIPPANQMKKHARVLMN